MNPDVSTPPPALVPVQKMSSVLCFPESLQAHHSFHSVPLQFNTLHVPSLTLYRLSSWGCRRHPNIGLDEVARLQKACGPYSSCSILLGVMFKVSASPPDPSLPVWPSPQDPTVLLTPNHARKMLSRFPPQLLACVHAQVSWPSSHSASPSCLALDGTCLHFSSESGVYTYEHKAAGSREPARPVQVSALLSASCLTSGKFLWLCRTQLPYL